MRDHEPVLPVPVAGGRRHDCRAPHMGSEPVIASAHPLHSSGRRYRLERTLEKCHLFPTHSDRIKSAWNMDGVVNTKEPFAGPASVIEYLGRYTHKIAISNHKLLDVNINGVTFRWRDYRDNQQKIMTLDGIEFLRRFCQHIMPSGFVRIRYYGILSTTRKEEFRNLQISFGIEPSPVNKKKICKPWEDICRDHPNFDPDLCLHCKTGRMVLLERFTPLRGPPVLIHLKNQTPC
jgi:hypothetical protein